MAKNLKLNIKNAQIAEAINLEGLKSKLSKKKDQPQETEKETPEKSVKQAPIQDDKTAKEEAPPRIKARSKSAFAEQSTPEAKKPVEETVEAKEMTPPPAPVEEEKTERAKTSEELRKELFAEELKELKESQSHAHKTPTFADLPKADTPAAPIPPKREEQPLPQPKEKPLERLRQPTTPPKPSPVAQPQEKRTPPPFSQRLGPTGRHIKDLLPPPKPPVKKEEPPRSQERPRTTPPAQAQSAADDAFKGKPKVKVKGREDGASPAEDESALKKGPKAKVKEFRDLKPAVKRQESKTFDGRDRQGLRADSEEERWRKRKAKSKHIQIEDTTIRPTSLKIRTPISIKDLASEMKLKASQLIAKLFLQGVVVTLNDILEDETTIQILGQEFGCEITIDHSEAERIRITDQTVKEEISKSDPDQLEIRPPVVAFMGHVDHGKTSLIDAIRKSNRAAGEAGAITQHIGAFRCHTPVGDIAILDTPGHEAFSAMRARGADVTDIVVLVVAGDEGIRQQTIEAIQHAKAAKVTIVVALNKADKPSFNPETVYRQLAEQELLPEAWGGQTITVNCSAHTGQGIQELLEMLALQAEVLELRANPSTRARGRVLESEMHKGMGAVTTVLVQNGTLKVGDALVFDQYWGRVKTMQDEYGKQLLEATPSTPVEITGLSGLPDAGQEFIVVKNEREAREIAEVRSQDLRQSNLSIKKKVTLENLLQKSSETGKKILNLILRADVQGSLEALKIALMKIESQKADINIIFAGVGEISESDVQLAAASKAVILGFHTQIESHSESLIKQLGVQVKMHDIIYHAIDDVKALMVGLLDRISKETDKGKAEVKATFKSSHHGIIAGCQVIEGTIHRNNYVRVLRNKEVVWKGAISSLKRIKEDVREVSKGLECGILLQGFSEVQQGDIIEAYEVTYLTQEL